MNSRILFVFVLMAASLSFATAVPPTQIYDCTGLQNMRNNVAANYVLANDIDCSSFGNFVPVGNTSFAFTGSLEGNGHVITGLTINWPSDDYVGLFGYFRGGVSRVGIRNAVVSGNNYVGALAGNVYQAPGVQQCFVSGCTVTGVNDVGGMLGFLQSVTPFQDNYANCTVIGTNWGAGGLIGNIFLGPQVYNSYAIGNVSGNMAVGGLTGGCDMAAAYNSFAAAVVSGTSSAGGFTGSTQFTCTLSGNTSWDACRSGQASCRPGQNASGCTAVNTGCTNYTYYYANGSIPLSLWNFNSTWCASGTFPGLRNFSQCAAAAPPAAPPAAAETPSLAVSVRSTCSGNVVMVRSQSRAVEGATVRINDTTAYSDAEGKVEFQGCGGTVTIYVTRAGYTPAEVTKALVSCESCAGVRSCTSDQNCSDTEQCAVGRCTAVPCACGIVENHHCRAYQCCTDSGCGKDEVCTGNACVAKPPPECNAPGCCTKNGDCGQQQKCAIAAGSATGSCVDVVGCGKIEDHALTEEWECGDAPACPACREGACISHRCVKADVTAPTNAPQGQKTRIHADFDGKPCAGCEVEVTGPDGKTAKLKMDENGDLEVFPGQPGQYTITIYKDGLPVKVITLNSLAKPEAAAPGEATARPAGAGDMTLPIVAAVAVIGGAVALYLYGKKK